MFNLNADSSEYSARQTTPFSPAPPSLTTAKIRAAVPKHLFEKSTAKALYYSVRLVAITVLFGLAAYRIDWVTLKLCGVLGLRGETVKWTISSLLWCFYWYWQSLTFTGIWLLGEHRLFTVVVKQTFMIASHRTRGGDYQTALNVDIFLN